MKNLIGNIILVCFISTNAVYSNSPLNKYRLITGKVMSEESGMSIPGVSIKVEGDNIGGITNAEGKFLLRVPSGNQVLIFSLSGFYDEKIKITPTTNELDIVLSVNNTVRKNLTVERVKSNLKKYDNNTLYGASWDDKEGENWDMFMSLLIDDGYDKIEEMWGFYMENRVTVYVENVSHKPLSNASVSFFSKGEKLVWQAITDQNGKVEMWPDIFEFQPSDKYRAIVNYNGKIQSFKSIRAGGGEYHLIFKAEPKVVNTGADIVFTGNLNESTKQDFQQMIETFKKVERKLSANTPINTELVFHNQPDPNGFETGFIKEFEYKNNSSTIDASFEYTLARLIEMHEWSDEKQARILFWAVDKLPSSKYVNLNLLRPSIQRAASKGIKIVPIATKSINKETELCLRFIANATNGEYIFLTDPSNTNYIKPSVGKVEVKSLEILLEEFYKKELNLEELL